MGYTIDFYGVIAIEPRLSDEYVNRFNEIASKRNNTYGDGDAGSFDHLFHNHPSDPDPHEYRQHQDQDTSVPGCWCQWHLTDYGSNSTFIEWDGSEKFYDYEEWLQYCVDRIKADHPELDLKFSGRIRWQGEEPDDIGVLLIKPSGQVHGVHLIITVDSLVNDAEREFLASPD